MLVCLIQFELTPLHLAAQQGHEGSVRKLIQADDCVLDHKTSKLVGFYIY